MKKTIVRTEGCLLYTSNQKKKIKFQYYDYDGQKQKILRHDGEEYILSPYTLYWNEDNYYLVGFSEKRQKVTTFRVDRL